MEHKDSESCGLIAAEVACIKIGDVGLIERGRFHFWFYAGSPLEDVRLGVDVPGTFEPLVIEESVFCSPRQAECLRAGNIQEINAALDVKASATVAYASPPRPSSVQARGIWRMFLIQARWEVRCGAVNEVPNVC